MLTTIKSILLTSLVSCGGAASEGATQGSESAGCAGGGSLTWIIMLVIIVGMFAVMIIPQRKRDKKVKEMLAAVKPGDRVRTIGGIYGTVTSIKDDIITISVGPDKVRLVFARGAIATIEDAPVETTIDGTVKDVK